MFLVLLSVSLALNIDETKKISIIEDYGFNKTGFCTYADETKDGAEQKAICQNEIPSIILVDRFVKPESVVLELGAGYGLVSCAVAQKQKNSGKMVAVEPSKVYENGLLDNLVDHNCFLHTINGVMGVRPYLKRVSTKIANPKVVDARYWPNDDDTTPAPGGFFSSLSTKRDPNAAKTYLLHDVERDYNLKFDTIIADCKGCFANFMDDFDLSHIKTIILKTDYGSDDPDCDNDCVDYDEVFEELTTKLGFKAVDAEAHEGKDWLNSYVYTKDT